MIYNYSAELITCWNDFIENAELYKYNFVKKNIIEENEIIEEINIFEENNTNNSDTQKITKQENDDYKKILKDFNIFYKYLENIFENDLFFYKSSSTLINEYEDDLNYKKEIKIKTKDNCEAFLQYFIKIPVKFDKRINKTRFTQIMYEMTDVIDQKSTINAFRPNYTHTIDATYIRIILSKLGYNVITIHDAIGIPLFDVDFLIKCANDSINELNLNLDIVVNSDFILL